MNKIFEVLYRPVQLFNYLDNLYEEELDINSNLIASIFGCLVGLNSFIMELDSFNKIVGSWGLVIIGIACVLVSAGLFILIYNYFFTYILYWIGKLLGSKGIVADTRTAIVYSILPIVLSLLLILLVRLIPETIIDFKTQYWFVWGVSILVWIWTMIILVIGLKIFNKYGVLKAIINILPLIGLLLMQIKHFIK
ncbi:hypothetical protein E9993_21950 [Labilibacter sediminis]|nr:hypothetical protein E9993_21950 [Labilibacter sediminis]